MTEYPHLCMIIIIQPPFKNKIMDSKQKKKKADAKKLGINEPFAMKGDWNAQSKILQEKFSQLTDADLKFEVGKENELIGRIETRLNKNRGEVMNIIRKGQPEKA
jgi:hypothetical protein